jgi:oleandomycin transport system permease protein
MTSTLLDTPQDALEPDTEPVARRSTALPSWIRHSLTLAWRNIVRLKHAPEQLMDVTLQPIIFLMLFVFVFGGAVSHDWHSYLTYLVPGIAAQTVTFATMTTGTNLNTDISKGVFDRFRSLPIARIAPLIGTILGDTIRFLTTMVVLLGFASVLGFRIETDPLRALAAVAVTIGFAWSFCWVSVLIGLIARSPGAVQGIGILIMFPLAFGSNVFTPASTMPGWLQGWVKINPVTQLVESIRGLLLGGPVGGPLWHTAAWSVGIIAVFAPLALLVYRRRA